MRCRGWPNACRALPNIAEHKRRLTECLTHARLQNQTSCGHGHASIASVWENARRAKLNQSYKDSSPDNKSHLDPSEGFKWAPPDAAPASFPSPASLRLFPNLRSLSHLHYLPLSSPSVPLGVQGRWPRTTRQRTSGWFACDTDKHQLHESDPLGQRLSVSGVD
jgi:hypothetical protein